MKLAVPAISRRGYVGKSPEEVPLHTHRKAPLFQIQHCFLPPGCKDLDSGVGEMKGDGDQPRGARPGFPHLLGRTAHLSKGGAAHSFWSPLS